MKRSLLISKIWIWNLENCNKSILIIIIIIIINNNNNNNKILMAKDNVYISDAVKNLATTHKDIK